MGGHCELHLSTAFSVNHVLFRLSGSIKSKDMGLQCKGFSEEALAQVIKLGDYGQDQQRALWSKRNL
uniref:Uncharacterized protein n=1 Tax=Arundo donax TaxID=35708 RepID=A0A0A8YSW3_ARUDO